MINAIDRILRWLTGAGADVKPMESAPARSPAAAAPQPEPAQDGSDIAAPQGAAAPADPQPPDAEVATVDTRAPPVIRIAAVEPESAASVANEEEGDGAAEPVAPAIVADDTTIVHAAETPVSVAPAAEEIRRRRELIRALFNDFWSGRFDKPAAFVDRLNEAETYLNERLAANGESWQLDAGTRKLLGLPPRATARDNAGSAARH